MGIVLCAWGEDFRLVYEGKLKIPCVFSVSTKLFFMDLVALCVQSHSIVTRLRPAQPRVLLLFPPRSIYHSSLLFPPPPPSFFDPSVPDPPSLFQCRARLFLKRRRRRWRVGEGETRSHSQLPPPTTTNVIAVLLLYLVLLSVGQILLVFFPRHFSLTGCSSWLFQFTFEVEFFGSEGRFSFGLSFFFFGGGGTY